MKKSLYSLIICIAIFTSLSSSAQIQALYEIRYVPELFLFDKIHTEFLKPAIRLDDVTGTPYLNDDFIEGSIFTTQKVQYVDIPLRYNIYNDQIEFRYTDNQVYAITAPEIIEKIEFGEYQLEYVPYHVAKKVLHGYLIVLAKGDATLYAKESVRYEKPKEAEPFKDPQPARFLKKAPDYYLQVGSEPARLITGQKDLKELFAPKKEGIDVYLKKNKIKMSDRNSLAEAVNYYNSL